LNATQAAQVLTSAPWSWSGTEDDPKAATLNYFPNGTVTYTSGVSKAHLVWHWKITGPNSVHIDSKGGGFDLNFDANWVHYTGQGVVNGQVRDKGGKRLDAPANPVAPLPAEPARTASVSPGAPRHHAAPTPAPATPAPSELKPWVAVFTEQFPVASDWAAIPLGSDVPATVRHDVESIANGIRAEAYKSPQASTESYVSANALCSILLAAFDEREETLRRNRKMASGTLAQNWLLAWDDRVDYYDKALRQEYARFSDAVMKSEEPKTPPDPQILGEVTLPQVPKAVHQRADAKSKGKSGSAPAAPGGNGGLNHSAYNPHYIWRSWWAGRAFVIRRY